MHHESFNLSDEVYSSIADRVATWRNALTPAQWQARTLRRMAKGKGPHTREWKRFRRHLRNHKGEDIYGPLNPVLEEYGLLSLFLGAGTPYFQKETKVTGKVLTITM